MSHPAHAPLLSPAELQKFEAPLIALANLSGGDLRKLFYAFFSFLNRRTDFYCILPDGPNSGGAQRKMGFREGQAEQILIASFRQFPLRRMGDRKTEPAAASEKVSPSNEGAIEEKVTANEAETPKEPKSKSEGVEGARAKVKKLSVATKTTTSSETSSGNQSSVRYTDEGKQVPIGNGGSTTRYVWTQTLEEAVVHIPVPEGTRAKDLDIEITPSSLSIRKKDASVDPDTNFNPLSGTLFARVKPSECTWTMESNSSSEENTTTILVTLDKVQKTWWSTVLSGDPEIDNTMVDSTRHIGTYDEKTQAQIRKIMFDQRQERLGLPSSDELSGEKIGSVGMPKGVEVIDQETLEKAGALRKSG